MNKKVLILACIIILGIVCYFVFDGPGDDQGVSSITCKISENEPTLSSDVDSLSLYIETSESMRGYFNDSTDFFNSIVKLKDLATNAEQYFVGSTVKKYNGHVGDLITQVASLNGGSSRFDVILPVLARQSGPSHVCMLITDGIPYVNRNTHRALSEVEKMICDSLRSFSGKAYAILKYKSSFKSRIDGNKVVACYYDMNNHRKMLSCQDRPYYVIAVGEIEDMRILRSYLYDKNSHNSKDVQKPDWALFFGIHDMEGHNNGIPDVIPAPLANVHKDLNIQFSLPSCISYISEIDQDYFRTNLSLYHGADKDPISPDRYACESSDSKGDLRIELTLPVNFIQSNSGKFRIEIADVIPTKILDVSCDEDTSFVDPVKTYGLKYLIQGIQKSTKEYKNQRPLFTVNFEYKNQ